MRQPRIKCFVVASYDPACFTLVQYRDEDSAKIQFAGFSFADSILRRIVGSEAGILHK